MKRRLEGEFDKAADHEGKEGATPEPANKKPRAKAKASASAKPAQQPMSPEQIRAMISPKAKGLAGMTPLRKDPRKEKALAALTVLREAGISGLKLPADDFDKKKFDCT